MKYFFYSLPRNLLENFMGANLLWNIFAMALTYVIVTSGLDWTYFIHTRANILLPLFFPAVILGSALPLLVPLFFLIDGRKHYMIIGWTLAQAALLGSIISSTYKIFTGRTQPDIHNFTNNLSSQFNFGFWNHGIFWGWPSSHTTIAFAMALAIIQLYPKNKKITFFSLLYAFYIGIGVTFSIHWFSDFAAGAIIGTVIGIIVGNSFKKILR